MAAATTDTRPRLLRGGRAERPPVWLTEPPTTPLQPFWANRGQLVSSAEDSLGCILACHVTHEAVEALRREPASLEKISNIHSGKGALSRPPQGLSPRPWHRLRPGSMVPPAPRLPPQPPCLLSLRPECPSVPIHTWRVFAYSYFRSSVS